MRENEVNNWVFLHGIKTLFEASHDLVVIVVAEALMKCSFCLRNAAAESHTQVRFQPISKAFTQSVLPRSTEATKSWRGVSLRRAY